MLSGFQTILLSWFGAVRAVGPLALPLDSPRFTTVTTLSEFVKHFSKLF
jgi:hypothetical protein